MSFAFPESTGFRSAAMLTKFGYVAEGIDMGHTRLFSIAQRALALEGIAPTGPRALTRRQALILGSAATIAACAPLELDTPNGANIAIVGGGVAGLTIAYRLARAGKRATLYEASGRLGGRMFTKRDFNNDGMFCELGGELVDSNHAPLMSLAKELGVGIQRLKPEEAAGEDVYAIGGHVHTEHEMLRAGKGAFLAIARQMAKDKAALTDANDNWTARAHELDRVSIAAYLAQFHGKAPAWVIDLLSLAYWGEYGIATDQQSSLNLVDFMAPDPAGDFAMFGKSDEVSRISGGSSALTDALAARLGDAIVVKPLHALAGLSLESNRPRLSFKTNSGPVDATYDAVALTLPFTKLREVAGLDGLGIDAMKLKSIRELGYGDNAKIMVGTTGRPWDSAAAHLPVRSSGEFYSSEFQVVWDTSRGQTGARGILTNFLTGTEDEGSALRRLQQGLRALSPAMADSLDTNNVASFFWARYPFARGSYSSAKVGQYTSLLEVAGTPELAGRLHFAGEHTSPDFLGFMCGGVQSGERVAAALLAPKAANAWPGPIRRVMAARA